MRQTLSHVITLAEAQGGDTTKQHLCPADDRHNLADNTMRQDENPSDPSLSGLFEMQLQVESEHDLHDQKQHEPVCERRVGVFAELATLVGVAEEVGQHGDDGANNLNGDVPP